PAGLILRAGFGIVALIAALAIAPLFVEGRTAYEAFAVLGAALLLDEMSQFLSALFRSFERMEFHALVVFSNRVLSMVFALIVLAFRVDTVILQGVKGTIAVAQYAVAYLFFDSLAFVGYNLGDTAMPRIARTGHGRDATRTFALGSAAILAFYLPLALAYGF